MLLYPFIRKLSHIKYLELSPVPLEEFILKLHPMQSQSVQETFQGVHT